MNPHNFHRITSLRFDGEIINLEGESSTCLTRDLLGRRCPFETIRYFDIEKDYISLPQVMAEDCAKMAWAFLLYLLGAYLFANGGQTLSLRWLAPFRDFKGAREVNWGAGVSCLSILFLGHTQGPCISLWGLRSSSRLVPLPLLLCSSCIAIMSIHMSFRPKLYFMLL